MVGWMDDLERLKSLFDRGGLSAQEYEAEKRRILDEARADRSAPVDPNEAVGPTLRTIGLLVAGSLLLLLLAGAAIMTGVFWPSRDDTPASGADRTSTSTQVSGEESRSEPTPAAAPVKKREEQLPDLSSALPLKSWSRCEFDEPFTSLFAGLDDQGMLRTDVPSVNVQGLGLLPIEASRERREPDDPESNYAVTVSLPVRGTWNGLKLSRIVLYDVEDAGHRYSQVRFIEPPEKVRSALVGNGVAVPPLGEWKPVDEHEMMYLGVETIPGGAALTCSYD